MKSYGVTKHAIKRAVERLGQQEEHAAHTILQRMQVAVFQGETQIGRIYDHAKSRTRMILAKDSDVVITVYSMDSVKPEKEYDAFPKATSTVTSVSNFIIDKARATIHREISKARRQFTREFRSLSESQALIQIEIAEMSLRKIRAKNPNTQAVIQSKIDAALTVFDEIGSAISELQTEFAKVQREANEFLPTEVTA